MCWSTEKIEEVSPKVAEKDIIVLKSINHYMKDEMQVSSPYRGYWYTLGKLQPRIHIEVKNFISRKTESTEYNIFQGYHFYNKYIPYYINNLCYGVIPKGTIYYENDREIVAEQCYIKSKVPKWKVKLMRFLKSFDINIII